MTTPLALTFPLPTRVRLTLDDGSTRELVVTQVEVAGVVKSKLDKARRPPAAAALPPSDAGAAPKTYEPTKATADDARSALRGGLDGLIYGPENLGRVVAVLAFLRRELFKLAAAPASKAEIQALRKALDDGQKPSMFCRAVVVAARDDWWRGHGDINLSQLLKNAARLAAQRVDSRSALRALLPRMEAIDPFERGMIAGRLADMSDTEAAELLAKWNRKLKEATK